MRAVSAAGALACLLAALSGCGSSHGASSNPASGGSAGASSTAAGASGGQGPTPAGGIKVTTTPKFVSPPAGSPVRSGVVQVAMRNISLSPDTIRVKAGSKIRWTNYDNILHNVTNVGGRQRLHSGNFGQGGTYEVQLNQPGVIHYLCTNHPVTMNGTIEVVG